MSTVLSSLLFLVTVTVYFFFVQLDRDCYGRPCGDDEVCIPGRLGGGGNIAGCSYSCMKFSK